MSIKIEDIKAKIEKLNATIDRHNKQIAKKKALMKSTGENERH